MEKRPVYELDWREGMFGHKLWVGICAYNYIFEEYTLQWSDSSKYETISIGEEYGVFMPLNWVN